MKKLTLMIIVLAAAAALTLAGCGGGGGGSSPPTPGDRDGDGVNDALDPLPDDPFESSDVDGDGVGDNHEARVRQAAIAILGGSLADVPVPELDSGNEFFNPGEDARSAAIQLGKALFWDMQLGSDGQACASCHFHAGADNRTRNQINPGLRGGDVLFGNNTLGVGGFPHFSPDHTLTPADFPLHRLADPALEDFNAREVLFDTNDVISSQGVFKTRFDGIVPGAPGDLGTPLVDDIFSVGGANTRRVAPRNVPTVINAVFNFTNFWDGRAHPFFNGETVLGPLDDQAGVWVEEGGALLKQQGIQIRNASLASQAVGPPLSADEMSFDGRTFPHIGRKLLHPALQPLGQQAVHPGDSVLAGLRDPDGTGLANLEAGENAYVTLIKRAFRDKYWNSGLPVTLPAGEFTQMEANFALFFGLAIQMYESTLVSDQTPFDRFLAGDDSALGKQELQGLKIFLNVGPDPEDPVAEQFRDVFVGVSQGFCAGCHDGTELTAHSVSLARATPIEVDFLPQVVDGLLVEPLLPALMYQDEGVYNIGVRPTSEDLGRGGSENGLPLSFTQQAIAGLGFPFENSLPDGVSIEFPGLTVIDDRTGTAGSFKVPGLRNVELTGPYMHNGGMATLKEVMEFYHRHGDFADVNIEEMDGPFSRGHLKESDEEALISFMLALTDERVKFEQAPFDHPQLFIPAGDGRQQVGGAVVETLIPLPAVGADGRTEPLRPFLNIDPLAP
jgi:cytochrome c peroxidase